MAVRIGELQAIVMVFALVGIIGMIALYVMSSVYGQLPNAATGATTNCQGANLTTVTACITGTYTNNTYTNSTSSISTLVSWLPIIGIVVAAAIVLGLLIYDMFSKDRKSVV